MSDHTVEFIALVRLCTATQIANEQAPIFQDLNIFLDIARRISKHEVAFARGTRGNIGSMLGTLNSETHCCNVVLIEAYYTLD